ncbi:internal alternative NAD(P)H-ubiquinone oxidoreductase A1, mitochondrial-like isoform X2 [Tasmannia lanceolata]|uniref:internal alternative NAD(P)H-ubiquinone oxidoreductase A1, mitochondrial-like isoform X2 n=1 Tax=Tasmannia lanceolata TaxID=3420 RepID=UPI0040630FB5
MAWSRVARSSLRQSLNSDSAARIGSNYLNCCKDLYARECYFSTLRNVTASSSLRDLSAMGTMDQMCFWSRGIRVSPQYQFPLAEPVVDDSDSEIKNRKLPGLEPTRPDEKPRVVVLGSGWAGCRFLKGLDTKLYDVVCISQRNHMVFTPLLASTCVGTLEFRFIVRRPAMLDPLISICLLYLAGAEPLTFNIEGVKEHAHFLREVVHAQEIRKKLLLNLMLSENPGISEEEKKRLLHCVVIGGGPTGVEFSGELSDFIMRDVHERYSHVKDDIRVTLIEANEILSSFDVGLRQYATRHLTKSGVHLMRGIVKEVRPNEIILSDGTIVPYGLLVWSTGVGPSQFVKSLDLPKSPGGRIGVDEWLRVPSVEDVYALGDCAGFLEQTGRPVLPALAQVAEREGKYLANLFSKIEKEKGGKAFRAKVIPLGDPFVYRHFGSMASVGRYKALVDLRQSKDAKGLSMAGFISWLIWRSAYLTRVVSWRNRFYVAVNWATTLIFGRDNSRIG